MIVNDLHAFRTGGSPAKAYSPLVVDADAVLASTIRFQCFQVISRRHTQVLQATRNLQLPELCSCNRCDAGKSPDPVAGRQGFSIAAAERSDHESDNNAKH